MPPSNLRQTYTVSLLAIPDEFHEWLTAKIKELGPEYERQYIMDDGGINLRDVTMIKETAEND